MQATLRTHRVPVSAPAKPRLAAVQATLAALGAAFLAMVGIHGH